MILSVGHRGRIVKLHHQRVAPPKPCHPIRYAWRSREGFEKLPAKHPALPHQSGSADDTGRVSDDTLHRSSAAMR
jgi:hypothetical protein